MTGITRCRIGRNFFDAKVPQAAALFPAELQTSLPSIEQIERALADEAGEGET
ncbi:hypothetical protein [Accumulibacter sp.]|uniref:hypothetical protein n=1 Tax=Accumulibacter sp. TaxID=2053492 RepID=UPI0025E64A67|nr:hypothetical protein [Accumulibacter sp.]MCM8626216.1 hypothetical protein [Accumulibacter sp.]